MCRQKQGTFTFKTGSEGGIWCQYSIMTSGTLSNRHLENPHSAFCTHRRKNGSCSRDSNKHFLVLASSEFFSSFLLPCSFGTSLCDLESHPFISEEAEYGQSAELFSRTSQPLAVRPCRNGKGTAGDCEFSSLSLSLCALPSANRLALFKVYSKFPPPSASSCCCLQSTKIPHTDI